MATIRRPLGGVIWPDHPSSSSLFALPAPLLLPFRPVVLLKVLFARRRRLFSLLLTFRSPGCIRLVLSILLTEKRGWVLEYGDDVDEDDDDDDDDDDAYDAADDDDDDDDADDADDADAD